MLDATALPQPSAAAIAVSRELSAVIAQVIATAGGTTGFDEYMRLALYEPGLGYYLAGAIKFGDDGDFITAPELSPLFGACIARSAKRILRQTNGGILEFGAGSGALAASVLEALTVADALPVTYTIVELSPDLRERQYATIAQRVPQALECVSWISAPPPAPVDGLVIANEIVDALPVRVFRLSGGAVLERRVGLADAGFTWVDVPADPAFERLVAARAPTSGSDAAIVYTSEVNVGLEAWVSDLGRIMRRGVGLIIDYGYPRAEYYHATRNSGTLQCHYRHRTHDDPFRYPGLQDITASVDFTHVAEAADAAGLHVAGFTEQGRYLLETGILDEVASLSAHADEADRQRLAFATKVLTLPTEMGSKFKFLAVSRDYTDPIEGFSVRDDRHRL